MADYKETGQTLIYFLTAIHGDNPFEIRLMSNFKNSPEPSLSLLRNRNQIFGARLDKKRGLLKKEPLCNFTPEEFGKLVIENYEWVSSSEGMGCKVCFTVNSPNFDNMENCTCQDIDILEGGHINAQFLDIDAPKEIRGNVEQINQFKREAKYKILSFTASPSCVIETKNGFHIYWFVENGQVHLFRHIQMQLVQYFQGDEACINESRLLRLPNFVHMKDPNNPFPVKAIIWNPQFRYSQLSLKDHLPELSDETLEKLRERSDRDIQTLMSLERKERVLELVKDKIDYTSDNDRKIITRCCMPNHEDRNPSAWIDKTHMFYHCQSCGTHLPLVQLAADLAWDDVIKEMNRYDVNLEARLQTIKSHAVNISEIAQDINEDNQRRIESIKDTIVDEFQMIYHQQINARHIQYIEAIVASLVNQTNDKRPTLIPLEMGGGKSTIIKVFLQQALRHNSDFGAIVVVDRIEDAKKFAEEINDYFGSEQYALPLYGFDQEECFENMFRAKKHDYCILFASNFKYLCGYTRECRYYSQIEVQKKYPLLIVTKKRIGMGFERLEKYKFYGESLEKERTFLLFDEKPPIISIKELERNTFDKYSNQIESKLANISEVEVVEEFSKAIRDVKTLFEEDGKRELFGAIDPNFAFSDEFNTEFKKLFPNYTKDIFEFPYILQNIIQCGGHRDAVGKQEKLVTSIFKDYSCISQFNTFIFDGTADIDLEYNHKNYRLLDFQPIRSYENLEINICDFLSASRTSLNDKEKLAAFCKDVAAICQENPDRKVYIPTFKNYEENIEKLLEHYIQSQQVFLAHYGATKGTNKFKDCNIVAICGVLHKSENHYIAKAKSILEQNGEPLEDINCTKVNKVRRFNDVRIEEIKLLDMIADYSQEIKRSSQRNNAEDVSGKVYIFHNDKIFLDALGLKFPNCTIKQWYPPNLIEGSIESKNNNPNQLVFMNCFNQLLEQGKKEIYYDEIMKAVQNEVAHVTTKAFSKLYSTMKEYVAGRGLQEVKEGRKKKLIKS